MRIAFLTSGFHIFDRSFLQKMVERGYEPYLISFHEKRAPFNMEGVKYFHYYPKFPRMRTLAIVLYLKRLLRRIQPDILHTGVVQSYGFYGALSGFHPTLLMPWGSDILLTPDSTRLMRWKTKYSIKRSDMITCCADVMKKKIIELTHYPADKIVVFPWGINLSLFQPKPNSIRNELGWEDKKILIMTKNFNPISGIEFFINVLPQIIKEEPQTRAILLGSGPLESHYHHIISEIGLEDYIYFAGIVDAGKVSEYLNAADIYISTTLSDATSLSLLESMACGLPVVVSNVPGNFDWVEDGVNGYIVPRGDSINLSPTIAEFLRKPALWYSAMPWNPCVITEGTSLLVERIVNLLRNPDLREVMGKRNCQIAQERANWDKNFDKLEEIYHTLAAEKERRGH